METVLDLDKLKVKAACCPTCKGWVLVSAYPQCETSKDSKKEFRACLDAGLNINVISLRESHALAYCPTQGECKDDAAPSCNLAGSGDGWLDFGEPLPFVMPCPSGRNDCPSGCEKCPSPL